MCDINEIKKVDFGNNVSYPRYYQGILYDGVKLVLQSPVVHAKTITYSKNNFGGESVLIRVEPWLRCQLDIIENFVSQHVLIPKELLNSWPAKLESYYKPLFNGSYMYIQVGKFCTFTRSVPNSNYCVIPSVPRPEFGEGKYSFTIEVPQVYLGPHKDGSLFSINMRITRIHCEVEPTNFDDLIQAYIPPVVTTEVEEKTDSLNPVIKRRSRRNVIAP